MNEEEKAEEKKELENPLKPEEELPGPREDKAGPGVPKRPLPWPLLAGGGLLLVLLLVFAYLLSTGQTAAPAVPPQKETSATQETLPSPREEVTDATTAALEAQGTSDKVSEIEKDLKATDLSHLDKELEDIEAELTGF